MQRTLLSTRVVDGVEILQEAWQFACGDLTTAASVGTDKGYIPAPYAATLLAVHHDTLGTTGGGSMTMDVNKNGTSVLTTKSMIYLNTSSSKNNPGQSVGSVALSAGASGSVDSITVNGVEVMSGSEAFDTNLTQTAANVAANITANTSVPNYTAANLGGIVFITAVDPGTGPNGFAVVSTATTITTVDENMDFGTDASVLDSGQTDIAVGDRLSCDIDAIGASGGNGLVTTLIVERVA